MTQRLILAAAASLFLAACIPTGDGVNGTPPPPQQDEEDQSGEGYRALGTEPFWSLSVNPDRMILSRPDRADLIVRDYQGRSSFNGWRYTSPRMTVDITFTPCSDGMSDRRYKDSVIVEVDGQTLRGCGGPVLSSGDDRADALPESLDGTSWRILSLNGRPILSPQSSSIAFQDGALSGQVGCNHFGGGYSIKDGQMTLEPVRATRMACAPDIMRQEESVLSLLSGTISLRHQDDGRMLFSGHGETMLLEQMP